MTKKKSKKINIYSCFLQILNLCMTVVIYNMGYLLPLPQKADIPAWIVYKLICIITYISIVIISNSCNVMCIVFPSLILVIQPYRYQLHFQCPKLLV